LHVDGYNSDGHLLRVLGSELKGKVLARGRAAVENFRVAEGDIEKDRGTVATAYIVREFLFSVEKLKTNALALLS
jgi:hypothetical protein